MDLVGKAIERAIKDRCVIIFFGSILKEGFGRTSDIDVAVFCERKLTSGDMLSIEEELEKLPILRDIDVVDVREIRNPMFLRNVLRGKIWRSSPELMRDLKELSKSLER